jgi:hypothetical protein
MKARALVALVSLAAACGRAIPGPSDPAVVVLPIQPPQPVASSTPPPAPPPPSLPVAAPIEFRCDGGQRFEVGHRSYCAHPDLDSWEGSERRCVAQGGHLMTLDNVATNEAVHKSLGSPLGAGRAAWMGLELTAKAGKKAWTWTTGEALTASSWNTGEPNNFDGNEACAEWLVVDGRWNDTRCSLRQPYICQQTKPDKPLTCRGGRAFGVRGLSYCFNTNDRTWQEAKRACATDGGELATFRTTDDNRAAHDAMAARFAAKRMWIGLTDGGEEGNWSWASGSAVEFTAWQPGEPNDFNGEDCGELHADVWMWNDLDCNVPLPSVCESPPKRGMK